MPARDADYCYSESVTSPAFGLIGKAGASASPSRVLAHRAAFFALIFGIEVLLASVMLDGSVLNGRNGALTSFIGRNGAWIVRGLIGFAFLFPAFTVLRNRTIAAPVSVDFSRARLDLRFLVLHGLAIALFAWLSLRLYNPEFRATSDALAWAWVIAGWGAAAFIAFTVAPVSVWVEMMKETRVLLFYAGAASFLACAAGIMSQGLWERASRFTLALVNLILCFFIDGIVLQPAAMRIGTRRFTVVISQQCSGLEGAALILVFGLFWLLLCRKDLRFPQALALVPIAMAALFFLNAVRIAALILIGHAGARDIATRGFHSQAGWIAFNLVAFGLALASRRLTWCSSKSPHPPGVPLVNEYPAASYLVPFLSILTAGMISRAGSGGFEWAYSLRLVAALAALWFFRRTYTSVDWSFGWYGPTAGMAIFTLWIGIDQLTGVDQNAAMPQALAVASPGIRAIWILFRIAAAVITVPIAEELAFRGFLLRRLVSSEFEWIGWKRCTAISVLGSSFVFGLLHGDHWVAAFASGVLLALILVRSGRLGDAIAAHATANALIAADVLLFHKWHLWQ
jgi:exosortase E/protease (VPEID-CTERM system)